MANETREIALGLDELRAVTGFAAESAQGRAGDLRAARARATLAPALRSRPRGRSLEAASGARRCAIPRGRRSGRPATQRPPAPRPRATPARAAMSAASAAYLHPLADAHQVKHILGAAAHAATAAELSAGGDPAARADHLERARRRATPVVVEVLGRYPAAPPGGGRVGELLRDLDRALRSPA